MSTRNWELALPANKENFFLSSHAPESVEESRKQNGAKSQASAVKVRRV